MTQFENTIYKHLRTQLYYLLKYTITSDKHKNLIYTTVTSLATNTVVRCILPVTSAGEQKLLEMTEPTLLVVDARIYSYRDKPTGESLCRSSTSNNNFHLKKINNTRTQKYKISTDLFVC